MGNASTSHSYSKISAKIYPQFWKPNPITILSNFENQKLKTHLFSSFFSFSQIAKSPLPILPLWDQTSLYGYWTSMENSPLNLPTILQPNSLICQPQTDVRWKKIWKLKYPKRIKRITFSATSLVPKRYNFVNFSLCVWVRVSFGFGFWIFSPYLLR